MNFRQPGRVEIWDLPTDTWRTHDANPEFLAAGSVDEPSLLATSVDGRGKICCSPVGWFSHDFVLFAASSWAEDAFTSFAR